MRDKKLLEVGLWPDLAQLMLCSYKACLVIRLIHVQLELADQLILVCFTETKHLKRHKWNSIVPLISLSDYHETSRFILR